MLLPLLSTEGELGAQVSHLLSFRGVETLLKKTEVPEFLLMHFVSISFCACSQDSNITLIGLGLCVPDILQCFINRNIGILSDRLLSLEEVNKTFIIWMELSSVKLQYVDPIRKAFLTRTSCEFLKTVLTVSVNW